MAIDNLKDAVNQAVSDFDGIKDEIEANGVRVGNIPTEEYPDKINEIPVFIAPRAIVDGIATETMHADNLVQVSKSTKKQLQDLFKHSNVNPGSYFLSGCRSGIYNGSSFRENDSYGPNVIYIKDYNDYYIIHQVSYYLSSASFAYPTNSSSYKIQNIYCVKVNPDKTISIEQPYKINLWDNGKIANSVGISNLIITENTHYYFNCAYDKTNEKLYFNVLKDDGTGTISIIDTTDITDNHKALFEDFYEYSSPTIYGYYDKSTKAIKILVLLTNLYTSEDRRLEPDIEYGNEIHTYNYDCNTGTLNYTGLLAEYPVYHNTNQVYSRMRIILDETKGFDDYLILGNYANWSSGYTCFRVLNGVATPFEFGTRQSYACGSENPDSDNNYFYKDGVLKQIRTSTTDMSGNPNYYNLRRYKDSYWDFNTLEYNRYPSEYTETRQYFKEDELKYNSASIMGLKNSTSIIYDNKQYNISCYKRSPSGGSGDIGARADVCMDFICAELGASDYYFERRVIYSYINSSSNPDVNFQYLPLVIDNKLYFYPIVTQTLYNLNIMNVLQFNEAHPVSLVHNLKEAEHIGTVNENALEGDAVTVRVWTDINYQEKIYEDEEG